MKLDAFCHILPPEYAARFLALDPTTANENIKKRVTHIPAIMDLDVRFSQMDEFGDYRQIINLAAPPVEDLSTVELSKQFARLANEGMAELVRNHPDRFAGFCASLPMNDVDAAIAEAEYAVRELGALGVQIYTHVNGKPMDLPEFDPFWERLAQLDVVIQVHPCRNASWPDYPTEERSKFEIWWTFGWEYDLSAFMARIVFSGVLERFPHLKFLIHHGGSMVPHFAGRVGPGWDQLGARTPEEHKDDLAGYPLTKRPIDYFRMFYVDTAHFGAGNALQSSLAFFGVEHTLFGSDSPFDPEKGPGYIRSTIRNIEELDISDAERQRIFEDNARRVFGLPAGAA